MGIEKGGKSLVVQANKLIKAKWGKMTLIERKIYLKLVSSINAFDEDFREHTFQVRELLREMHLGEENYDVIREATARLVTRGLQIEDEKSIIQVSLMSSAQYLKDEGTVSLCFDPRLKPYLLKLKEHFTMYALETAMKMSSAYSIKLYELMKEIFDKGGIKIYSISELRDFLGIEAHEYPLYGNFKKRIIIPAQKELKEISDLCFDFEEKKHVRKVEALKFYVYENRPEPQTKPLFEPGILPEIVKDPNAIKAEMAIVEKEIELMIETKEKNTDKDKYHTLLARLGELRADFRKYSK